ncbi:hypothetical protein [Undibacterium squillarum]|nr:hypothetical protein [Undibacterium squillarum]
MATKASEDKDIIYFPIDQGEQAKQAKPEYLLARPVYQRIAGFLKESVNKTSDSFSKDKENIEKKDDLPNSVEAILDLDEHRAHNAILLDGGRGTGKSTILVNLPTFMKDELVEINRSGNNPEILPLSKVLLILKPVDPTLLENDDDLFLNIIVAALLRNKEVKDATQDYEKSKTFYARLQALGSALEGTQKQKSEFGMDKLRAFIGNHSVSDEVHKLFYEALKITGKRLIVLPIDDVDTSLQHAFNNLEVVRRYLASPYVVPIISGDLDLFHEVIWRNFFEGITAKARTVEVDDAKLRAKNLADEYERKLLPVARRNLVQSLKQHIANPKIYLSKDGSPLSISLSEFFNLLNRIHNFWLNDFESSWIKFSFSSVRSLAQLISAVKSELIELDRFLSANFDLKEENIVYLCEILRLEKREEYLNFEKKIRLKLIDVLQSGDYQKDLLLIYLAQANWLDFDRNMLKPFVPETSVFEVALFQPLDQLNAFKDGCIVEGLGVQWREHLDGIIFNEFWLNNLPEKTVLSYPPPDKGVPIPGALFGNSENKIFVSKLLSHNQVYLQEDHGSFVYFGRLFEILVLGLFKNVCVDAVRNVLNEVPFYSLVAFSKTKVIGFPEFQEDRISKFNSSNDVHREDYRVLSELPHWEEIVAEYSSQLIEWRSKYNEFWPDQPSALLIYRVMNKFFTQLAEYESDWGRFKEVNDVTDVAELGLRAFNAFCAAIGSYEVKNHSEISNGSGFGYVGEGFVFSEIYGANIQTSSGQSKGYAYEIFHTHPIRNWLNVNTPTYHEEDI